VASAPSFVSALSPLPFWAAEEVLRRPVEWLASAAHQICRSGPARRGAGLSIFRLRTRRYPIEAAGAPL
jgi:hypothetical protein